MDNNNFPPTEVLSAQHEYDLFLLNQEIDTPFDNLKHQDSHACEPLGQYDTFLIHATNHSHLFALPQFMAQHNCEDVKPTDTLITVPTLIQAFSNHTLNPICAHNPMAPQCNQSQYLNLAEPNLCSYHIYKSGQPSQTLNLFGFPMSTRLWGHVLKKSATDLGEQDFPVKWFKFIYPSSKPRMTETSICAHVHVAYSPLASTNHQWTINLHDGYPLSMP